MTNYEERMKALGIELPKVPKPVAEYIPAKRIGNLVFCSGQGPIREGRIVHKGKLGVEKTVEEGYDAAKICVLNCLAAVGSLVGSLNKVDEIIKVTGFVNSAPNFFEQPEVINGASELLVKIFGDKGRHTRCAIGTSHLPRDISVEIEMILTVED